MVCPNCQMVQPQDNLPCCVRCNYPLQARMQGFFTKSSQTGYSRADAYSAARQTMPQQQYAQVPYPSQPQNANPVQTMYDANGNQIYVQMTYDQTGRPVYIQMMPKIVGRDAAGTPLCTMVPVGQIPVPQQQIHSPQQVHQSQYIQPSQQVHQSQYIQPSQQMHQSQYIQPSQQIPPAQKTNPSFPNTAAKTPPKEISQFMPRTNAQPPPVPVLPKSNEQPPEQPSPSVPDRPATRASFIASSMYNTAPQNETGSFFVRMQQQYPNNAAPVSAEEILRQEAQTAFVQQPADTSTILNRIFETQPKEYQMNTESGNPTFSVNVSPDEVASVSEKNLYKPSEKSIPQISRKPESKPEPPLKPEPKEQKTEGLSFFRNKKSKEKPKPKPVIVDPDEIFGDGKNRKRSTRSMKDTGVTVESMLDDPENGNVARKVLTDEVVQQAYDSAESAEIAKALEQLNQGIFPKSFK